MKISRCAILFFLFTASVSFACGPMFPNSYFMSGSESEIFLMPEGSFLHEITGMFIPKEERPVEKKAFEEPDFTDAKSSWSSTLEIDLRDLSVALQKTGGDTDAINATLEAYRQLREAMHDYGLNRLENKIYASPTDPPPVPFDLIEYQDLLARLPQEFRLYATGACAFYNENWQESIRQFESILDLPEQERINKTLWATFMIGRASVKTDLKKARDYFDRTKALAAKIKNDDLGLVDELPGWMAYIEEAEGNRLSAMKRYIELFKNPIHRQTGYVSLRWMCARAFRQDELDSALAADPMVRRVLISWVVANPGIPSSTKKLLKAIPDAGLKQPVENADRLAWAAYNTGDMSSTEKWLGYADPNSPYSRWIRSKLFLRQGKPDEALAIVRDLSKNFPKEERWWLIVNSLSVRNEVSAELGILMLSRQEYIQALDALLRAGYWSDAAYIAERVLSIAELAGYIEEHKSDPELSVKLEDYYFSKSDSYISELQYLCARKYARNNQWEQALPLYPPSIKERAELFYAVYTAANNKSLPDRERAEKMFEYAQMMRDEGMELIGTEIEPDWTLYDGSFELSAISETRTQDPIKKLEYPQIRWQMYCEENPDLTLTDDMVNFLKSSQDEQKRTHLNVPNPDKRFHYRYLASDLMWQCAALLPDNDELTAKSLYFGGIYISVRDPDMANKFFKALVKRCGALPVGKEAKARNWFPKDFY